jgi:hypothetical protein
MVAGAQRRRAHRRSLDEPDDHGVVLGQVGDHRRPDADLGRTDGVLVLVVAVNGQQAGVVRPASDDEAPRAGRDLVVRVGQPAGQLGDRPPWPGQLGDQVEHLGQRLGGAHERASIRCIAPSSAKNW